jgi:hypothetical protein
MSVCCSAVPQRVAELGQWEPQVQNTVTGTESTKTSQQTQPFPERAGLTQCCCLFGLLSYSQFQITKVHRNTGEQPGLDLWV